MTPGTDERRLIVNADDFGQSPGVNRGIIRAHEDGILTSASLMVRWPSAAEAAAYARQHTGLSVGLHFDFAEWACRDYTWVRLYQVVPEDDPTAVRAEAVRQRDAFREIMGRDPTHLDSHQHTHRDAALNGIFVELADEMGVTLRGCSDRVRYWGDFYGQNEHGWPLPEAIGVDALLALLAKLPGGFTELGCHPGEGTDVDSMYSTERAREVETLCDPRVRKAVKELGIRLCSFHDVP